MSKLIILILGVLLAVTIVTSRTTSSPPPLYRVQQIGEPCNRRNLLFERRARVHQQGPNGVASISLRFPPEGQRNPHPIGCIIVKHHIFSFGARANISRGALGLTALYLDIVSERGGTIDAVVEVYSN